MTTNPLYAGLAARYSTLARFPDAVAVGRLLVPGFVVTGSVRLVSRELSWAMSTPDAQLQVNMAPQEGKSTLVKCAILRELILAPDTRIAIVSYSLSLARKHSRWIRSQIITHGPQFGIALDPAHSAVDDWGIAGHRGGLIAAGIGGSLTGNPVDVMVVDDPVKNMQDADSEVIREATNEWFTSTVNSRLATGSPIILVQTRWHQADLSGALRESADGPNWRVINIPAQCDDPATDPLGRELGEFMDSARLNKDGRPRTREQWESKKLRAGSRVWNALYQGRPSPEGGGIIRDSWWRTYAVPLWQQDGGVCTVHGMDEVLISADLTFKDGRTSDYVAIGVWGRAGASAFLLDQVRDRLDFPATLAAFRQLCEKWPQATLKLVEDKANGPALIAMLSREIPGIVPVQPQGSKQARVHAVVPLIEAGNVHLPSPDLAPWIRDFIAEAGAFPTGAHDDQVDQTSQALDRLLLRPLTSPAAPVWDDAPYSIAY